MSAVSTEALPSDPRIIFMGTPDYAVLSLEALVHNGYRVVGVVTQPDRPKGRSKRRVPPPVKQAAERMNIPVFQPENVSDRSFCDKMLKARPHIFVVIAFGQLLSQDLLDTAQWGGLNIHASLLPKYRGAAPIQWAIINQEKRTGLTAMRMEKGLDSGPILEQMKTPIGERETAGELHDRLSALSAQLLLKTLKKLSNGDIRERPQDHRHASYAPKIDRHTGRIRWEQPAVEISFLIRGLDPWPGAYTTLHGKTLKLFSAYHVDNALSDGVPGKISAAGKDGLMVETGSGILAVKALQLAGKKRMPAADFFRGFPIQLGTVLGK